MLQKSCAACTQELPLDEFSPNSTGVLGRQSRCKTCRASDEALRRKSLPPLTEEQRLRARASGKRYRESPKGKLSAERSRKSRVRKAYLKVYRRTERGQEVLRKASQKLHMKRRKFIQEEKIRQGCFDCGYREHPEALDFDHIRGTKEFDISKCMGRSLKALKEELAKCVVRCSNCHRIKTVKEKRK